MEKAREQANAKTAAKASAKGGRRKWPFVLGGIVAVVIVAAVMFQWDWLIPYVEPRVSAALGRPVHIAHLHVKLGRVTHIDVDGITIDNPADWPGGGQFGTIERLGLDVDAMTYIKTRQVVLPAVAVEKPHVEAKQLADGKANWNFAFGGGSGSGGPGTKIGTLKIDDGQVHVVDEKLKADFNVALSTRDGADGQGQIVADAKGTYANQPITAQFVGGALLSLRDEAKPYPVDLKLANGPTRVSLVGSVQDPLAFKGVDLKLTLAGPDMSLLLPLTGIAIPKTPAYQIAGKLDYSDGTVKFTGFEGRVGSSDLGGNIEVDTKNEKRPVVTADLQSKRVDLKDLGGFIGAEPGDADKGTKKAARNDGRVIPNEPISLPKLNVADVHLKYRAARIEGRSQPLDNMRADLDIVDGNVNLHPLSFGIGAGTISGDIALSQAANEAVHAKATISFNRVDFGKLLNSTGVARGAGTIGGRAVIDGTGRTMAEILGHGNGELKLFMGRGGNVSALLVDLSGLEFGNALLSALGIPTREILQCAAVDLVLQTGVADLRTGILDTDDSRVRIVGDINLRNEALGLKLKTDAKHFSVGSLPTPIDVKGTLASPSIAPEIGPLAIRGGAAVALGIVGTPLAALLPTIQFGTGEDNACRGLLANAEAPPRVPAAAGRAAPVRRTGRR